MEVIVFESQAYYKLQEEMSKILRKAIKEALESALSINDPANEWIHIKEAKKIIPFRSKTSWQQLRDRGDIVFSQFGHMILYNKKSLLHYVTKHKVV